MILSTSTGNDILEHYEGEDAADRHLETFFDTPFRYFNLDLPCIPSPSSVWLQDGDAWMRIIERVGRIAEEHKYHFICAHSPSSDYYADPDTQKKLLRAIERSFAACAMLGIRQTAVHGLLLWKDRNTVSRRDVVAANLDFYLRLADSAEKYGVDILAENYQRDTRDCYPFTDGAGMRQFVKEAGIPRLHLLWDTGHANIADRGSQYDDIVAMGDELRCLHVHDNWGNCDCHSIPFSGSVNFDGVMRGLIDIGYSGAFNFEASDLFIFSGETGRGRTRTNCRPGDRLSDPPKKIITAYMNLLYQMGEWMLGEYGL